MASSNSFHGSTGQNAKFFNWLNSQIRDEYKDQCNGQPTFNCWDAQTAKSCPVGLISQNNRISLISSTFEMVKLAESYEVRRSSYYQTHNETDGGFPGELLASIGVSLLLKALTGNGIQAYSRYQHIYHGYRF